MTTETEFFNKWCGMGLVRVYARDLRLFIEAGDELDPNRELTIDEGAELAIALMKAVKHLGGELVLQNQAKLAAMPPILTTPICSDMDKCRWCGKLHNLASPTCSAECYTRYMGPHRT